jgi:bacillithiol biosynthesis cysteine-adding enzyme BshC
MATEDHDFDEINYFQFQGKKIQWNQESSGAVGDLSTEGLKTVLAFFKSELGAGNHAKQLISWFENAYLQHQNLAAATRFLANELFGKYGLVILDANEIELKKHFIPYIQDELFHQTSFAKVNSQLSFFKDYLIQVNPREINLFYMTEGLRERIVFENDVFRVLNTELVWNANQMEEMIEKHPERFSPNVILRPLYQEVILPNLCYIGGGGELAYWLELKPIFDHYQVPFPILLLRNSVLLATEKQTQKADKLQLSWADLFLKSEKLKVQKTHELSQFKIDFTAQKEFLKQQFDDLLTLSTQTHHSFLGAVKAQERKQVKGLEHLEKRLLKAEMKIHEEALQRILKLKNELFPNDGLQERTLNFSEFYENYGFQMIDDLVNHLKPLEQNFHVEVLNFG